MNVGYARVSTEGQDLGRQLQALEMAGCEKIYQEKISGGKKDRPELDQMIKDLQPGDTVIIQKLDRLGRSLSHLLHILSTFQDKKVIFKSLSESIDTNTATGRMVYQLFGVIAEFERAMISERTKHSLAFKRSKGVILGRPKVDQSGLIEAINERLKEGKRAKDIQKELKLTAPRYHRLINSQTGNTPELG